MEAAWLFAEDFLSLKPPSYPLKESQDSDMQLSLHLEGYSPGKEQSTKERSTNTPAVVIMEVFLESAGCLLLLCSQDGLSKADCKYIQVQCLNWSTVTQNNQQNLSPVQ